MVEYIAHLPIFLGMVTLGILLNIMTLKRPIKKRRIVQEIIGSVWISVGVAGTLEHFTDFTTLLVSFIASMAGYFNSRLITIIGDDILLALGKSITNKIKSLFKSENLQEDE